MNYFFRRVLVVVLGLSFALTANAQVASTSSKTQTPPVSAPATASSTGNLSCFDYYHFGSVQADLEPTLNQTVPGATLTFTGKIVNSNDYPLLNGTLYVKIFRRDEKVFAGGDGNPVVDQFVVAENVMLPPKGSRDTSFEWQVPMNAEGGEYYAAYFFTTSNRYNLMGLSFTDDVVGNQAPFTITTETDPKIAKLSKPSTTLNGQDHHFAAFPLHFKAGDTVTVKTTLKNPDTVAKTIPLQWNQYAWDAMNKDNLRFTKTEVITLAPGETKEVFYEVQPTRESVVYVVAVAQDNQAKSILNIRYVRDGIEETRINFPSITTFPLAKDTDTTLFACAHAINSTIVPGNTLTLTLTDKDGKTVHEYRYQGDITGAMGGYGESFKPDRNYNQLTLTATLERNGVIVEQVKTNYDCKVIDPNSCLPESAMDSGFLHFLKTHLMTTLLTIVIVLLLAAIGVFFYKKRKDHTGGGSAPTMTTPIASLLLLFFLPVAMFLTPLHQTEAKSVQWSTNSGDRLFFYWSDSTYGVPTWNPGTYDANISVTYSANLKDASTGATIADGASIPVGTKITCDVPYGDSDLVWNATGYSGDSPYGHWVNTASRPSPICSVGDALESNVWIGGCGNVNSFIALSVNRPNSTCLISGPGVTQINSTTWQLNSPGSINATVTYPTTYGYFYYQYYNLTAGCNVGCVDTTYPMVLESDLNANTDCSSDRCFYAEVGNTSTATNHPGSVPSYKINVPQQTIPFTLTAVSGNNPPATPAISGPANGVVGTTYGYTLSGGTDPDGDQIRYGIMDSTCTNVVQWLPGSGYFTPGTQTYNTSWGSAGSYTIKVLAEDSKGARSSCATQNVSIAAAPPVTADLKINGQDGPINVAKNTTVNLSWTSANAASCSKWGGTWGSGQTVGTSGTDTTVVTATATYMVNCGGTVDSVVVNVVNQTPNAPAITYTSGTLQTGQTINFNIQASDPDNDNIFYEVDWDNNGTVDATTMTVPSGTTQPASYSWATAGTVTFQARTVDTAGARSGWTQHSETITAAPPTADLRVSVNGGAYSNADTTIDPSDTISLKWSSTNAASCTGTNFNTGNAANGTVNPGAPAPNTATTYTLTCGSASDPLTITVRQRPNFSQPNITYSLSPTFDAATGMYDWVDVTFNTQNTGGSDTKASANYQFQFDRGRDGYEYTTTGSLGLLTVGQTVTRTERVTGNITFGDARIQVTADNTNAVTETDEGDNVRTFDLTIPPPDPGLSLTADKVRLRQGEATTIRWSVASPYAGLSCVTYGPNLSSAGATLPSGTRATASISAQSVYTLECTEATTNTKFTKTVTVETEGKIEEI